jgi:hypothetical protein
VPRRWYRGLFRSSAGLVSRERSFGSIGRGGALENEPVVGGARGTAFSATCSTMKPPGPVMNSQRFHSITGVQDELVRAQVAARILHDANATTCGALSTCARLYVVNRPPGRQESTPWESAELPK